MYPARIWNYHFVVFFWYYCVGTLHYVYRCMYCR